MSAPEGTFVIFNPASGGGRGAEWMATYLDLLRTELGAFEHGVTEGPGDERRVADEALAAGFDRIVAVGGDGTWSNVATRIVAHRRPGVSFGLLPAGTGNDFVKTLGGGVPEPAEAVRALARGVTRRVDVGALRITREGRETEGPRYFILFVGFGFATAVLESLANSRFLGSQLAYRIAAARNLFSFRGFDLSFTDGASFEGEGEHLLLVICNGSTIGGSFRIAPGADVSDGRFDVRAVSDAGPLARLKILLAVERARHEGLRQVRGERVERFGVRFARPQRFQLDGELQEGRVVEARVEVMPGELEVVVPHLGRTEGAGPRG